MTQKEDTRTEGRKREGRTAAAHPLLSLHCVLRWRYLPFYKSHRSPAMHRRPRALQFPWHYTAAAESIPPPSSSRATCRLRIVWQRASSERRQSNSSSLQDKQKGGGGFHRAEGRRDGWKEGEWVVAVADAGHTALHAWHRWRPAAATMTHGAEYWGGLHFSTDFTKISRGFHATRAVDAAEEARKSLA